MCVLQKAHDCMTEMARYIIHRLGRTEKCDDSEDTKMLLVCMDIL